MNLRAALIAVCFLAACEKSGTDLNYSKSGTDPENPGRVHVYEKSGTDPDSYAEPAGGSVADRDLQQNGGSPVARAIENTAGPLKSGSVPDSRKSGSVPDSWDESCPKLVRPASLSLEAAREAYRTAERRHEQRLREAASPGSFLRDVQKEIGDDAKLPCLSEMAETGHQLFEHEFGYDDGLGGGEAAKSGKGPFRRVHEGLFGAPETISCPSCHWVGGPNGAGAEVDNAFLAGDGAMPGSGDARNSPALVALGVVQALAAEMSRDLQRQRDEFLARMGGGAGGESSLSERGAEPARRGVAPASSRERAPTERGVAHATSSEREPAERGVAHAAIPPEPLNEDPDKPAAENPREHRLVTKGVEFGVLRMSDNGELDLTSVRGVDADLVVKPFGWKGTRPDIASFATEALQVHMGIQGAALLAEGGDAIGRGTDPLDPDGDGRKDEFTARALAAMTVHLALLELPIVEPLVQDRHLEPAATGLLPPTTTSFIEDFARGREKFHEIGCASCHTPMLVLNDPVLRLEGLPPIDLSREMRRPAIEYDANLGGYPVWLFSDLKRHNMGRDNVALHEQRGVAKNMYLTPRLWGVADSAPYLHDGRAPSFDYALSGHDGEASGARRKFFGMTFEDKGALRVYLMSLRRAPRVMVP
jgi:hypothetical protein